MRTTHTILAAEQWQRSDGTVVVSDRLGRSREFLGEWASSGYRRSNATSGGLSQHLKWMWGSQGVILGVYEPLSWTFKALVIAASGRVHAHTFFTISVVLHGINTLILATLTVKLLAFSKLLQEDRQRFENEAVATWKAATTVDWLASALAASVYASHPLRVEIVGWLSCQSYLVGSAAALLCLHCTQTDIFKVKVEPYSSELSSAQQHSYASLWQYFARRP